MGTGRQETLMDNYHTQQGHSIQMSFLLGHQPRAKVISIGKTSLHSTNTDSFSRDWKNPPLCSIFYHILEPNQFPTKCFHLSPFSSSPQSWLKLGSSLTLAFFWSFLFAEWNSFCSLCIAASVISYNTVPIMFSLNTLDDFPLAQRKKPKLHRPSSSSKISS